MKMEGIGSSTVTNKYTYNYKELNDDFGLNWHDYGARWYDAALGRWWVVDPMAELQADNSPYAYVYNNPLAFVDPTGMYGEPVGADGLTNSQWIESSRPGNSWMADNYRKQNRQEDWLRGMLIGKTDGALNEEGPGDPPPYIACPLCPFEEVNGISQVTISAKKTVRSSVNLNWLQNATTATQARRDMVGNDVRYLYTFADDSPGYWVEALNVIFLAEGAVDIGLWAAGRVAARDAATTSGVAANASSQILIWCNNAKGHLIKHADALGFGKYTPQQLQKMLPQLRSAANQLYNNINPALTRIGRWGGQADDVLMHITNDGKMLITRQNGEFITVIQQFLI